MSIVLQSTGGGSVTINEPTTASNFTVTLPAAAGTVMVSGNMPAFSAYLASTQTTSHNVSTKVLFDTEDYDTNNNFASSRFTPTVAGYYQLSTVVAPYGGALPTNVRLSIFKNGTSFKRLLEIEYANSVGGSYLVYFNGSTDYAEIYIQIQVAAGNPGIEGGSVSTAFSGVLVRSA
jgi:hypothetical protein